ncbi:FAD-binding protein [Bradyrhizobium lablabi]|uniref:FAD-binding protein n=1 Tax=Bradyrhizobium lablabi TaxID=722472 RepID=UPI00289CCFAA|nr:FAD-binding protein [Bradyrhizobium lablabi]
MIGSVDEPSPSADISYDPAERAAAAVDFGGLIHKQPRAVARPASAADIAVLVRWAKLQGLKVAARGQGHSIFGRALSDDGVVIDMSKISAIHHIQPDRITVDAGATWKRVLDATLPRGLMPPVLTNYLGLSVGGTIAVGGIGGTSSREGMQTDNVLELDVVTGDGRELTCSATSNPDLFDRVRAGLGQCGIITRATVRLLRAPQRVRRFQLFYRDLASLTADQRRVLTELRFDQLQGAVLPDGAGGWRYQLEGAVYHDNDAAPDGNSVLARLSDERSAAAIAGLTYREDALAFEKFENLLRSKDQWRSPKPWLLTFLPGNVAEQLARDIIAGLTSEDVGLFGRITFYPMSRSACRTPLVRLPEEDVIFVFNIIRLPPTNDAATMERMVGQNRMLYQRIRRAGGVLYPVSAFPMASEDWKDHFGSHWSGFRETKQRHDPANMLTPGYNLF